jgi:hypothetical protein
MRREQCDMQNSKFKTKNPSLPVAGQIVLCLHVSFCILNYAQSVTAAAAGEAQAGATLVDRVLARVDGNAITLTDVQAAIGLGLVQPRAGEDPETAAREQLIERELLLAEIARFPPPDPSAADIEKEVASLEANAGRRLEAVMEATGLDAQRIRETARDSLRIQAYLGQRFGTAAAVSEDDARQYYEAHPAEFTRGGSLLPFLEVLADARQRASDERRRTLVNQWLRDLRARADVVVTKAVR